MADGEPPIQQADASASGAAGQGQPAPAEPPTTERNSAADQQPAEPYRPEAEPTAAADQTAGAVPPFASVWPPAPPVSRPPKVAKARKKIDWQGHFATWQSRLGNGLAHLGRALTHFGRWLTRVGQWLARRSEVRPSPLQTLAMLGGFAVLSIFGAFAFPGNALGQACVIAFVPGFCIALGILGNRWYTRQGLDQQLARVTQNAIHLTQHLHKSVRYVDDRLSDAQSHLENGRSDSGLLEVVRAKTAAELSLGTAEQASHQWESVSASGARAVRGEVDRQTRPRITEGNNPKASSGWGDSVYRDDSGECIAGSVARVEDQYTLIINRGSEHGTKLDMVFAVLADGGDEIVDPETGKVIGELPIEKLRVKVIEVQSQYARAATFRTFTPARVEYPALTGYAGYGRVASGSEVLGIAGIGAFDSIDESISKMLETELTEPRPIREKIANAKAALHEEPPVRSEVSINAGDRVRQVG